MSREYRQLVLEAKAAPPQGEGGAELEEKRGLLSAGRLRASGGGSRANQGTFNAIAALQRDGQRTMKREKRTFIQAVRGKRGATTRNVAANKRMIRLSKASRYLQGRAGRNALRGAISFGDR